MHDIKWADLFHGQKSMFVLSCYLSERINFLMFSQDIRRELKLEPFVVLATAPKQDETVQRAVVSNLFIILIVNDHPF